MAIEALAAVHSGVWLATANGGLARVFHAERDRVHPGGVRICVATADPGGLMAGTGRMHVHDLDHGGVYCVQGLTCRPTEGGYEVTGSTLGEPIHDARAASAEDYLVFPGCEPMAVGDLRIADGACPQGRHLRAEVPAGRWATLPMTHEGVGRCSCGAPIEPQARRGDDSGLMRRWAFKPLRMRASGHKPNNDCASAEVEVDVVRLEHRCTIRVGLYAAMPGRDQLPAVVIGHVRATEFWPVPARRGAGERRAHSSSAVGVNADV